MSVVTGEEKHSSVGLSSAICSNGPGFIKAMGGGGLVCCVWPQTAKIWKKKKTLLEIVWFRVLLSPLSIPQTRTAHRLYREQTENAYK